jgi:hypothetical protein
VHGREVPARAAAAAIPWVEVVVEERQPLAERVAEWSSQAVAYAKQERGTLLDFSPASLAALDSVAQSLHEALRSVAAERQRDLQMAAALSIGAYLGEIVRRKLGGEWVESVPGKEDYLHALQGEGWVVFPMFAALGHIVRGASLSLAAGFAGVLGLPTSPALGTPALMAREAQRAVDTVRDATGVELDFTCASLAAVDTLVTRLRSALVLQPEGSLRALAAAASPIGAYVGEVLRRELGAVWTEGVKDLPSGVPSLQLACMNVVPAAMATDLLEGRPTMLFDGSSASSVEEYYRVVARLVRSHLDTHLYGAAGTRETVKAAMSTDLELANTILNYAEMALSTAGVKWGVILDFAPTSLKDVDAILGEMHDGLVRAKAQAVQEAPTPAQVRNMAIVWGAYVGEVMRRHLGGTWSNSEVEGQGKVLRLRLGSTEWYPLRKVEKRLVDGPGDNVAFYYHAIAKILSEAH